MWTYRYNISGLPSHYKSIKEFLDSDCGLTESPSLIKDPWENSGDGTHSGKSDTTPSTKSSSKTVTKYDPTHYKRGRIEVWDFIVDQQLDYLAGNCVKYICRAGHKNYESELDDWLKVKAYVDRKIQQLSQ